jgi:hypothetical protein
VKIKRTVYIGEGQKILRGLDSSSVIEDMGAVGARVNQSVFWNCAAQPEDSALEQRPRRVCRDEQTRRQNCEYHPAGKPNVTEAQHANFLVPSRSN